MAAGEHLFKSVETEQLSLFDSFVTHINALKLHYDNPQLSCRTTVRFVSTQIRQESQWTLPFSKWPI